MHDQIARFVALLLERNRGVNLTAARDEAAVAAHVCDALTLLPYVRSPLVDVGSGGGFPAIPLAIASGAQVTMVEATIKKARFLQAAVDALELPATVLAERAETVGRDPRYRETFAAATARAVGSLPTVLELTVPLLAIGGIALLQRGMVDERERQAAAGAARVLGAEIGDEILLDGDRRILVAIKREPTATRFPRRAGVPANRPLCA
ncbi:MAG: 16S rRNA (guanine(527)-N(7))-methyltransferase RsmG [Vulcanimicrobiaceae bacterium]